MGYFRELPNLQYQSPFTSRVSSDSYVTVKNLFRRMKIRDDLQNVFTIFNKFTISDGERPDTVARNLYGKSTLDWVVLTTAGIINVRNEWPLSSKELYDFTVEKYGLTDINNVKHYETTEVKNSRGVIVLPKGKIVDQNFTIPKPDISNDDTATLNPVRGVTYYEYEVEENEKKRNIFVLRSEYLQQFLNDIRNEMTYKRSSQYVNDKLIKTENTRVTI
tara:strand:+ start:801 stop:1457 length:657 start_codon:yes stop_codon:yes gene_type:complete